LFPQRVVTLSPHLAELVCAAGACERLVGVSVHSDFPAAVNKLPRIGDAFAVNLEVVLGLRPDLVLAWDGGTPAETVQRLRGLGLRVESPTIKGLDGIADALEALGAELGTADSAAAAARAYRARLAALRARWRGVAPLRVVYQIETAPAYTINGRSPISEVMSLCGGVNVFADLPTLAAPVGAEAMLAAQPEAVLYGGEENTTTMDDYWEHLPTTPAARRHALYAVNADLLARAAPRVLDGVEEVCARLDEARAARTRMP
jgi:ABC-type hemin transport system substrate-binding protein